MNQLYPMFLDRAGFTIFQNLITWCWQITIFAGMGMLILRWLGGARASVRHAAWTVLLVMLPFLPLLGWLASETGTPQVSIPVLPYYVPPASQTEAAIENNHVDVHPDRLSESPVGNYTGMPAQPWRLLVILYLSGASVLAIMSLASRMRISRWIDTGLPVNDIGTRTVFRWASKRLKLTTPVKILQHCEVPAPVTVGIIHPAVLVPEGFIGGLSTVELRAFALHELAHVKRRDPLVFSIATAIRFILFFHPLIWYATRKTAELAEFSCDDMVLAHGADPSVYAEMLARSARILMKRPSGIPLSAKLLASRKSLSARVRAVLTCNGVTQRELSRWIAGLVSVCALFAVAVAVAFPLTQRDSSEFSDIRSAIISGSDNQAIKLLDLNPWLAGLQDGKGRTLLHYAARYNGEKLLEQLLKRESNVNALDGQGFTPLHVAAGYADLAMVTRLVRNGANVNACDRLQRTPLHVAIEHGNKYIAEYLVEHGSREDIFTAITLERGEMVERLIHETPEMVNTDYHQVLTPLQLASTIGNIFIVEKLLNAGADVNAVNKEGETALHFAAWNGFTGITRLLIEHGADMGVLDRYGLSPLMMANQRDWEDVVTILEQHNAALVKSKTPAHVAWDVYRNAPYSNQAFMASMIAGGNYVLHRFGSWWISEVYEVGQNGGGTLMAVKITDDIANVDTMFLFEDGGRLIGTFVGERVSSWSSDPAFNIDSSAVDLLRKG